MSSADIEELYRSHARRIAGYLMRTTGDAEVAADLTAYPLDPPAHTFPASGFCGPGNMGFPKTPGFSRAQVSVPAAGKRADGTRIRVREVLVFGRVPERATAVVITSATIRIRAKLQEGPKSVRGDFYGIAVRPPLEGARINWLDADGTPGSRGISLMPPVTRR